MSISRVGTNVDILSRGQLASVRARIGERISLRGTTIGVLNGVEVDALSVHLRRQALLVGGLHTPVTQFALLLLVVSTTTRRYTIAALDLWRRQPECSVVLLCMTVWLVALPPLSVGGRTRSVGSPRSHLYEPVRH